MSLAGDKAHLTQLAGELPQQALAEICGLVGYAGEEAKLVLGDGPRATELEQAFAGFRDAAASLQGRLAEIENLLYSLGR